MSTQHSTEGPIAVEGPELADISALRARRRDARRRMRMARVDLGIGVVLGLLLILLTPGLAIAGLFAVLAVILCFLSLAVGPLARRRRARRARAPRSSRAG